MNLKHQKSCFPIPAMLRFLTGMTSPRSFTTVVGEKPLHKTKLISNISTASLVELLIFNPMVLRATTGEIFLMVSELAHSENRSMGGSDSRA